MPKEVNPIDINKIRNTFFKKSLSVGYHNVKYEWKEIMAMILKCVSSLESLEDGAESPSAQTVRDRLQLTKGWLEYFHEQMLSLARYIVKRFPRMKWSIAIDEKYQPFFGNREKLNKKLKEEGIDEFVHGYRAKTPGATGSFCFLVISLCCGKFRLPLFVRMMKNKESYKKWTDEKLRRVTRLVPQAIVLADRGFGKRAWFFAMLEKLKAKYDVRVPLKKKETKNKIKFGAKKYQQWFGEGENKVLLNVNVVRDEYDGVYLLANNLQGKTPLQILSIYRDRWKIENIFKDTGRVGLRTSSCNPNMRLFSFVLSLLLFALWQFGKVIEKFIYTIRRFAKDCVNKICEQIKCTISLTGSIQSVNKNLT